MTDPWLPGGLLPLWPWVTMDGAAAGAGAVADPRNPMDAATTALEFTRTFLGYTGVDHVTTTVTGPTETLVGVGSVTVSGDFLTAATIRLVRFGGTVDGSWVVVGTQDPAPSMAEPGYGATVGSSFLVGGRITGVDEALRVSVLAPAAGLLGSAGPVSVGGVDQPWSVPVQVVASAPGTVLTVAVATGGHLFDVEWFAVTAALAGEPADPR